MSAATLTPIIPIIQDDAVAVYDDLIETLQFLAIELDGEAWDGQRKPLTKQAIEALREKLL